MDLLNWYKNNNKKAKHYKNPMFLGCLLWEWYLWLDVIRRKWERLMEGDDTSRADRSEQKREFLGSEQRIEVHWTPWGFSHSLTRFMSWGLLQGDRNSLEVAAVQWIPKYCWKRQSNYNIFYSSVLQMITLTQKLFISIWSWAKVIFC